MWAIFFWILPALISDRVRGMCGGMPRLSRRDVGVVCCVTPGVWAPGPPQESDEPFEQGPLIHEKTFRIAYYTYYIILRINTTRIIWPDNTRAGGRDVAPHRRVRTRLRRPRVGLLALPLLS